MGDFDDMVLQRRREKSSPSGYIYWLDAFDAKIEDSDEAYQKNSGVEFDNVTDFYGEIQAWVSAEEAKIALDVISKHWSTRS